MDSRIDSCLVWLSGGCINGKGVRTDLLELTKLPYVKGYTARVFWEGGLKTISAVAGSDPGDIIPLLVKVLPAI